MDKPVESNWSRFRRLWIAKKQRFYLTPEEKEFMRWWSDKIKGCKVKYRKNKRACIKNFTDKPEK